MRHFINTFTKSIHKRAGHLFPRKLRQKVYWFLNPPDPRKHIDLVFDIVGSCNLRCPSCAVGNMGAINPAGKMDMETYKKILEKAHKDFVIQSLVLYNWGETVLHPQLAEFVSVAKEYKIPVLLSSNLNVLTGEEAILKAKPDGFRISLSGFTQPVYSVTHRGGDIEKVKANMRRLSEAKKRVGNTETTVTVYFHKYKNNLHEVAPMKALSEELGFIFQDTWAYYMPLEKVVDYAEGRIGSVEKKFVEEQFALPIGKAIQEATKYKSEPCSLLNNQVVLDMKGNLILCCAVYDYSKNRVGSYLEMQAEDVEKAKANHPSCATCANYGLHKYFLWQGHPELSKKYESLVQEALQDHGSEAPANILWPEERLRALPTS